MKPKSAGYSGTPLAKKLGVAEGVSVVTKNALVDYAELLELLPPGVRFEKRVSPKTDIVHVFSSQKQELKGELEALRHTIRSDCAI